MNLRVARAADLDTLRALESEAFGLTWESEVYARELQRADCLYSVGDEGGEVVALASLNWILDEVHLLSLAVPPAFQRGGRARRLLGTNLAFCQQLGLRWMTLEVKWENAPALALYKSFGFTTVGRRPKYYRDGQDARIMWSGDLREPSAQEDLEPYREWALPLWQEWKESRPQ